MVELVHAELIIHNNVDANALNQSAPPASVSKATAAVIGRLSFGYLVLNLTLCFSCCLIYFATVSTQSASCP